MLLPFQTLSHRKKKAAVESEVTVKVVILAFDLLFLNGKSFLGEPLEVRAGQTLKAPFISNARAAATSERNATPGVGCMV